MVVRRKVMARLRKAAVLWGMLTLGVLVAFPTQAGQSKSKPAQNSQSDRKRPPKAEICDHRTPVFKHVVEEGEHLGLVAGRHGVLKKDLLRTNPDLAENPDHIRVGQVLDVCPEIRPREIVVTTHMVEAGESMTTIAGLHKVSLAELIDMQEGSITDPNRVRVGQELRIVKPGPIVFGFEPDPPRTGRIKASKRLSEAEHYVIKRPNLAFGTPQTIATIERALSRYRGRAHGGPKVHVGDISQRGGGKLRGHRSHQRGVDVDVGLVLRGSEANNTRFVRGNASNIDVARTWLLVKSFLDTEQVRYIFLDYRLQELLYEHAREQGIGTDQLDEWFQYPRGVGRNHGIVRHWPGHRNHIHVRFRR